MSKATQLIESVTFQMCVNHTAIKDIYPMFGQETATQV